MNKNRDTMTHQQMAECEHGPSLPPGARMLLPPGKAPNDTPLEHGHLGHMVGTGWIVEHNTPAIRLQPNRALPAIIQLSLLFTISPFITFQTTTWTPACDYYHPVRLVLSHSACQLLREFGAMGKINWQSVQLLMRTRWCDKLFLGKAVWGNNVISVETVVEPAGT